MDIATRAYQALNRDDRGVIAEIVAPDVELRRAPGLGEVRGSGEVAAFATPDAFAYQRFEPHGEVLAHEDRLMIAVHMRARGAGSGVEIEQVVSHAATFRGRRISRLAIFFDRAQALAQLEA